MEIEKSKTARDFAVKKLEIEKTKTTFIYISFKSCILGGLSFFDFQLFIHKNSQGRKLSAKIPTFGNSALETINVDCTLK